MLLETILMSFRLNRLTQRHAPRLLILAIESKIRVLWGIRRKENRLSQANFSLRAGLYPSYSPTLERIVT